LREESSQAGKGDATGIRDDKLNNVIVNNNVVDVHHQ